MNLLQQKEKGLLRRPPIILLIILLTACSPVITNIRPDYGPPGTEVKVRGKRLVKGGDLLQTRVELNGSIQPDVSGDANELTFTVQEGATSGKVKVVVDGKSDLSDEYFDVVDDYTDENDAFTFGGLQVQAERVTPSGNNQEVLFGILRPKWAPNQKVFADYRPDIDTGFIEMNEFWTEASYGEASFTQRYLTESVIELPKSENYYYHRAQQRDIKGHFVDNSINFPAAKQLVVSYENGNSFTVNFPAGNLTRNDIADSVNNAISRISVSPPDFDFQIAGNRFRFNSRRTSKREDKFELSGNAIPYLGFGTTNLYNLPDEHAIKIYFGAPVPSTVDFATDVELQVTTLGDTTRVNFAAGSSLSTADIINRIQAAMPPANRQQPFIVEQMVDPLDGDQRILVFKTVRDADGDHGFDLTIGGTARTTLGLDLFGEILKYEKETFRGHNAITDGFNAYASSLPGGTDLDPIFGPSRMFVGILAEDNQLRAHHSVHTFPILDERYERNFFVARANNIGPFAHETGHALDLPDLYDVSGRRLGNVPNNWDIMDCSYCDAHPVQWLKSRHHKEPEDQGGAWASGARIASLSPPAAQINDTYEFIVSPGESPWITNNPFAASHPGIQVVHAVELVPTDPKDVFFIENRQPGPYVADHLGDQVDFSQDIPGEGVILYQGRRIPIPRPADFLPVSLLTPYGNPLNVVGETYEHVITNANRVTVEVLEKLTNPDASAGSPSYSYHIRISWGQGSFYDLAIREWNPAPWESEDIWVDNRAENGWDVYTYDDENGDPILNGDNVAVDIPNRLYARIRNLGDIDVTQDFDVIWRVAVPQQAGGPIETELGRVRVTETVPGNGSIITPPFEWVPRSSNEEHVCIKAEIVTVPGELNGTANNSAQENITQWFSPAASPFAPVVVEFETKNPYDDRTEDFRIHVPDVPAGWTVTVEDANFRLGPGQVKRQTATIRPIHGYFHNRGLIKELRFIPELEVNIEALMPVGDIWERYGGVTAIVHPVNSNSTIRLREDNKTNSDGSVEIWGKLESSGVLYPPLNDREVNIRIQNANRLEEEEWLQTKTRADGSFDLLLDASLLNEPVKITAYHSGGKGFKPASSNEILIQ